MNYHICLNHSFYITSKRVKERDHLISCYAMKKSQKNINKLMANNFMFHSEPSCLDLCTINLVVDFIAKGYVGEYLKHKEDLPFYKDTHWMFSYSLFSIFQSKPQSFTNYENVFKI